MLTRAPVALFLTLTVFTLAAGQDRDDKKSKIPPLIYLGDILGEVNYVDGGSDKLVLLVKDVVREPVRAYGPQRLINGGVSYVTKEVMVQKSYNLSPDVKIRLMNKKPDPKQDAKAKQDNKKKAAAKQPAKKDAKKAAEAAKDAGGEDADKGDKAKMEAEEKEKPEKDPDAKMGGAPGKKSQLAKGQIVRVALGRNNDPVNPQIYVMAIYVLSDGK